MLDGEIFYIRANNGNEAMNKICIQEKVSMIDIDLVTEIRG
jgi:hypothetical protein